MLTIFAETIPGIPLDPSKFNIDGPVALLILVLIAGLFSVVKGWVVPKAYYDREVKRGDDYLDALKRNTDVIDALTVEVRARRNTRSNGG